MKRSATAKAAKVAPACPCGRTLVPLWRWDDLICPAGCRDDKPALDRKVYWLAHVDPDSINTSRWVAQDKPGNPYQQGTWVRLKSGSEPAPATSVYGDFIGYRAEHDTVWELADPPTL